MNPTDLAALSQQAAPQHDAARALLAAVCEQKEAGMYESPCRSLDAEGLCCGVRLRWDGFLAGWRAGLRGSFRKDEGRVLSEQAMGLGTGHAA